MISSGVTKATSIIQLYSFIFIYIRLRVNCLKMKCFSMLQNVQCIYEYALEDCFPNLHNGVLEVAWMRDVVRKVNYLSPTI